MTKFNTDLANGQLQEVGEKNGWQFMSPWDYFYEGILYGMELGMENKKTEIHYAFSHEVLGVVAHNFFKTKEEAEEARKFLKSLSEENESLEGILKVSEVVEVEGHIDENYSQIEGESKITASEAKKLFDLI